MLQNRAATFSIFRTHSTADDVSQILMSFPDTKILIKTC